ncbi:MAG: hypothetical protein DWQ34_08570 [Planctomycetota bacterium]|nr:MAG: hypothetical protein DWQ34_08570 [Planctomycetota bacterium]REK22586.1 MAG: hypothetical protein DWQ41_19070 [Planctomycetota bacterium]REK35991.1 MAG: hypothetical protein DWQ45_09880 [Planctomycetota bacterium]
MSKRRALFVVNNKSGGANEEAVRKAADEILKPLGVECHFFVRRKKGMSRRKATRRAIEEGFDLVVAAGGDGTVSRVADELQGSGVRLGVVPTGTANLIARSLRLPLDIAKAMRLIADPPRTVTIDGMHVPETGKTYFSHISMGVYSRIAKMETEAQKKAMGRGVYLWNLFKELRHKNSWEFKIQVDGETSKVRSSLVILANIGDAGIADMQWGKQIRIDDGHLDLCIVSGRTVGEYGRLAWHSLRGRPEDDPAIDYLPVHQSIRIETSGDVPVRADGKLIGEGSVEVEVRRGAVEVMTSSA